MKIGIVRSNLSSTGGAERYALNLIGRLVASGHEVHVFTGGWPADAPAEVNLHKFKQPRRRVLGLNLKTPRYQRSVLFQDWLHRETGNLSLDLLFTMERTYPSDVFRAGDGVHREWLNICLNATGGVKGWLTRRQKFHRQILADEAAVFNSQNTRLVVCNSHMIADEVVRHYQYPRERIHVVPNGVDFERFYPATSEERAGLRSAAGIAETDFVLLFVGAGFWRKGLDIALNVTAELRRRNPTRSIKLVVVGKGNTKSHGQQAARLGIADNVHFIGGKSPAEVLQWYQMADALLFPTRYDPFANVCLEANACGLPVLTTNRNGFSEQVKAGVNGIALDINSSPAVMAEAADVFLQQMPPATVVRESVAHLSLDAHVTSLLNVLSELIPEAVR